MVYFRKLLLWFRKMNSKEMKPDFAGRLLIISLATTAIGIVIDIYLPFNYMINAVRGILANIIGFSAFGFLYSMILIQRREIMSKNSLYVPLRERFSYNQRRNISVLALAIVLFFMSISGSESAIYTLKGAIIILTILMILLFLRKNRNEHIKEMYDIPDVRDLEFEAKRKGK